jgi:hypothetical protein
VPPEREIEIEQEGYDKAEDQQDYWASRKVEPARPLGMLGTQKRGPPQDAALYQE